MPVIHEAIPQHPQKYAIIRTLNEAKFKTSIGQHLDAVSKTIEHSTWGRYEQIVEHKTSHYSFYCPIRIGFLLADELDHSLECQKLAYKIGSLFQAQDDYLDIFGQPEITGKIGQDIANGKCTWFSCRTLEKISKDLPKLKLFVECFGQPDERQIDQIKKIMEEASIEDDFHQWSNKTVQELHAEIDHFGKKGIRQVFHSLVEALTGRRA
uniref:Farnesyl diphosphate synthase n=1 Tax=Panagrolaimus sp. JU765 TaxID=591449 RepID=A0AC34QXR1_9BILA